MICIHSELNARNLDHSDLLAIVAPEILFDNSRKSKMCLYLLKRLYPMASAVRQGQDTTATTHIHLDRFTMDHGDTNKMFLKEMGGFDPYKWYRALLSTLPSPPKRTTDLVAHPEIRPWQHRRVNVTYINRQSASRQLSAEAHKMIMGLSNIPFINFIDAHMGQLTPFEQMELARHTDVMIGGHGNGLTHFVHMHPHRFAVEIFMNYQRQWDYYSLARIMGHEYLMIYDGEPISPHMKFGRLWRDGKWTGEAFGIHGNVGNSNNEFSANAIKAIERMIYQAMQEIRICSVPIDGNACSDLASPGR